MLIYIDIDIYTELLIQIIIITTDYYRFIYRLFGHFPKQWLRMNTQRKKTGEVQFIYKDYHLFGDHINKFESLSHNLMMRCRDE